jgi:glycerol-3-phosphate dehydrogenase (NAD(P)+)|tara:strand:+ start:2472 stop:3464 length:993 start_codon:yes stop_codon:yes gene_type:complete
MSNILIIGAGSMGTAFSFPCTDNNHNVSIIGTHLENDFIDQVNSKRRHPALNCELPEKIKFIKFDKLNEEINKKIDLIVIAVVSKGIEWISLELSKVLKKNIPILVLTKGLAIHNNEYELLTDKMERLLKKNGIKATNISIAGGPCLAKGLSDKVHTSVVFANKNIEIVNQIKNLIETNYYHIFTSSDVAGVGICAAIKNIFSMAIGTTKHLNTAAFLIQQSINEMTVFVKKLNGKKETVMGLAGIADLYVSADGGRNSKMGKYLGEGMTFREAKSKKMPNVTVEGADLALEIGKKIKSDFEDNKLPLMISMINTICDEKPLNIEWKKFK